MQNVLLMVRWGWAIGALIAAVGCSADEMGPLEDPTVLDVGCQLECLWASVDTSTDRVDDVFVGQLLAVEPGWTLVIGSADNSNHHFEHGDECAMGEGDRLTILGFNPRHDAALAMLLRPVNAGLTGGSRCPTETITLVTLETVAPWVSNQLTCSADNELDALLGGCSLAGASGSFQVGRTYAPTSTDWVEGTSSGWCSLDARDSVFIVGVADDGRVLGHVNTESRGGAPCDDGQLVWIDPPTHDDWMPTGLLR